MPRPTSSPATPSPYSPFGKEKKDNRGRGHAYAYGRTRAGMVGPFPRQPKVSGLDTDGILAWAKDNKWYLLGGALVLGAGLALLKR